MAEQTRSRRTHRKGKRREQRSESALTHRPPDMETESTLLALGQGSYEHTPLQQTIQLQGLHLSSAQRQALAFEIGRTQGNHSLTSLIQKPTEPDQPTLNTTLQRQEVPASTGANPGGRGPGKVEGAKEEFYKVRGAKLNDLLPQLNRLDEFAAETETEIGCEPQERRLPNGQWQAVLKWRVTKATTTLPEWVNYNTASAAAQKEWDRYLGQVRKHEQAKHIEAVRDFLTKLGANYLTVTEAKKGALHTKVRALFAEVNGQIQTEIHDGCGNGVEIDAILHADRDQER